MNNLGGSVLSGVHALCGAHRLKMHAASVIYSGTYILASFQVSSSAKLFITCGTASDRKLRGIWQMGNEAACILYYTSSACIVRSSNSFLFPRSSDVIVLLNALFLVIYALTIPGILL